MEIVFLGTSSMVPTKTRNHSSAFVKLKTYGILVDCGEGTQRQMRIAGLKLTDIDKILITHWHGDHVLGLPGLLQTLNSGSNNYSRSLEIYGPPGIDKKFEMMKETFDFELDYDVKAIGAQKGVVFKNSDFRIETDKLDHAVPSYGYSIVESDKRNIKVSAVNKLGIPQGPLLGPLQEGKPVRFEGKTINPEDVTKLTPGKKLTFIGDTELCKACVDLAENADLLICESTYANNLAKKAELYKHLTAGQAALIANKSGAKKLIITHFSQRYKNTQQVEEDARAVFDKVVAAKDFMRVRL